MNVLFINNAVFPFSVGGGEIYAYHLSRALIGKGHFVSILAATQNTDEPLYRVRHERHDGIRIRTINNPHTVLNPGKLRLLYSLDSLYINRAVETIAMRIVHEANPDIVHIHHLGNLSSTLIERLQKANIPVVVTLHDYWFVCVNALLTNETLQPHYPADCGSGCVSFLLRVGQWTDEHASGNIEYARRKAMQAYSRYVRLRNGFFTEAVKKRQEFLVRMLANADAVIAPSEFSKNIFLSAGLPHEKILFSKLGIQSVNLTPARPQRSHGAEIVFGYLGRILPEKGVHVLIQAFNSISGNARLIICGKTSPRFFGYKRYIQKLAEHNASISFLEGVPNPQLPGASNIFDSFDAMVMPSCIWENAPVVIQESFLSRTPVIASDIGGMRELVESNGGILFKSGSVEDLAAKLQGIIDDHSLLEKNAPKLSAVKTIEDNADELLALYKHFL